jgi:hypothetical protein
LEQAGEIKDLELQPKFDFTYNNVHICDYVADFRYRDMMTNFIVIEDTKGLKTRVYSIKRKLMKAFYKIVILETGENQ